MRETNLRWGIKVDKLYPPDQWALGIGLSHWGEEPININLDDLEG